MSLVLGQSSQLLKMAAIKMFVKKALFISCTATIEINICKFYSLEEAIKMI